MRILLINPPDETRATLGPGTAFIQHYEPLGLLYVAAVLRQGGHQVTVLDAARHELDAAAVVRHVAKQVPDAVGLSTLTCSGAQVMRIGRRIKQARPETFVMLGNIHASVFAQEYLRAGACDVVVHGEGEWIALDLMDQLSKGREWRHTGGISHLSADGHVVRNGPHDRPVDLSELPLPARDLLDRRQYGRSSVSNQHFVPGEGAVAKSMMTSRGCRCHRTFCAVCGEGRPRYAPAAQVVDEMAMLERDYQAAYIYIQDSMFLGDRERTFAICRMIRERGLRVRWGCDAHVGNIDPEVVRQIASANCYELSLGIESGTQRILNAIRKGTTLDGIRKAVETVKRHSRIRVEGLFILGLPGETPEDCLETIRFARSLPLDMAQFSVFTPYPGSENFQRLAAAGELDTGRRPDGTVDVSVWSRYTSYPCFGEVAPIWVPPSMTTKTLRALQKKALRDFYLRPRMVWDQARRLRLGSLRALLRAAWKGMR